MFPEPSAEQFIREFFGARIAALNEILHVHMVYWLRFHDKGCLRDSRRNVVENSEAEEIEDIQGAAGVIQVVTKRNGPFRCRYHLESLHRRWLICEMDTEIGGTWKNLRSAPRDSKLTTQLGQGPQLADAKRVYELAEGGQQGMVERFMNRLFQERTASYAVEAEIYGKHLKSFFSPKYDWQRHVPSSKASAAESIESIAMVAEDAHVVTHGFHRHRSRYRLHSLSDQWFIQDADFECPICAEQGLNPNCFWCKGTIWNHVRPSNI